MGKAYREIVAPLAAKKEGISITPAAPEHKADLDIVTPLATKQEGISLTPAAPEHKDALSPLVVMPHMSFRSIVSSNPKQ